MLDAKFQRLIFMFSSWIKFTNKQNFSILKTQITSQYFKARLANYITWQKISYSNILGQLHK